MYRCKIINGEYAGRTGTCTPVNQHGNVMVYTDEGEFPYRVCLRAEDVEIKEEVVNG